MIGSLMMTPNILHENQLFSANVHPDVTIGPNFRYDFIVNVGVLLIKAGLDENFFIAIALLLVPFLQTVSMIDRMYETKPSDRYCRAVIGRRCRIPRAKAKGGYVGWTKLHRARSSRHKHVGSSE